ncbi:MAG: sulfatase-like hydrolase/transferase, partial [Opitutae bacterium]|nr:sulfatase-like hydrolase/transferase [Opitutae bacterium]
MIKFVIHRIQGAAAVVRGTPFIKMWSRSMFQVACLLIVLGMSALAGAGERQPNLVVLFADDLGYGELSCQGNPEIPTPHIDSIARNGVRFTSGYVAGPNCSPSRAGLLTGRTPTRFGYEFNPTGALNEEPGFGLPSKEITIAEALHDAGYTTGLIGKW